MAIKKVKKIFEHPFEEGKTYKTKMSTGESFLLTKIIKNVKGNTIRFDGIYENNKELGVCPLSPERLIPETYLTGEEFEACSNCGEPLIENNNINKK